MNAFFGVDFDIKEHTKKLAEKKIKKEDLRTILFVSRLLGMMQY
jgi:hypothetical protein